MVGRAEVKTGREHDFHQAGARSGGRSQDALLAGTTPGTNLHSPGTALCCQIVVLSLREAAPWAGSWFLLY